MMSIVNAATEASPFRVPRTAAARPVQTARTHPDPPPSGPSHSLTPVQRPTTPKSLTILPPVGFGPTMSTAPPRAPVLAVPVKSSPAPTKTKTTTAGTTARVPASSRKATSKGGLLYSRKGPQRKKCVWCSLTRGHFCEQASRCAVREKLGGIGSDELLEKCRQLKRVYGEQVKRALINEGAIGIDRLAAQTENAPLSPNQTSSPTTNPVTPNNAAVSVLPSVISSATPTRAMSIEAARRTQESPFESLLIAASIYGLGEDDEEAVSKLKSLRMSFSDEADEAELSPNKADTTNSQQQQFVTPRRLQWGDNNTATAAAATVASLAVDPREHRPASAPPYLDAPNGASRKRKSHSHDLDDDDTEGYDDEVYRTTSAAVQNKNHLKPVTGRAQSAQGRPYRRTETDSDSDARPSKKTRSTPTNTSGSRLDSRGKVKREARQKAEAQASHGRRLNNTKLKGSGIHPMKIFVMDKRVWLFCACRECKEIIIARDSEATSPYCSAKCQTREQNIRQNRVKCGTFDYTDAKVAVYRRVQANNWDYSSWTAQRSLSVKQMLAVECKNSDCLVSRTANTKK